MCKKTVFHCNTCGTQSEITTIECPLAQQYIPLTTTTTTTTNPNTATTTTTKTISHSTPEPEFQGQMNPQESIHVLEVVIIDNISLCSYCPEFQSDPAEIFARIWEFLFRSSRERRSGAALGWSRELLERREGSSGDVSPDGEEAELEHKGGDDDGGDDVSGSNDKNK